MKILKTKEVWDQEVEDKKVLKIKKDNLYLKILNKLTLKRKKNLMLNKVRLSLRLIKNLRMLKKEMHKSLKN